MGCPRAEIQPKGNLLLASKGRLEGVLRGLRGAEGGLKGAAGALRWPGAAAATRDKPGTTPGVGRRWGATTGGGDGQAEQLGLSYTAAYP